MRSFVGLKALAAFAILLSYLAIITQTVAQVQKARDLPPCTSTVFMHTVYMYVCMYVCMSVCVCTYVCMYRKTRNFDEFGESE